MAKSDSRRLSKERRSSVDSGSSNEPVATCSKFPPTGYVIVRIEEPGYDTRWQCRHSGGRRGIPRDSYDDAMRDAEADAYRYQMGS